MLKRKLLTISYDDATEGGKAVEAIRNYSAKTGIVLSHLGRTAFVDLTKKLKIDMKNFKILFASSDPVY